jgi:hypothetical protein
MRGRPIGHALVQFLCMCMRSKVAKVERMMTSEVSILIWLPVGEVPQAPVFEGSGATTCGSLAGP